MDRIFGEIKRAIEEEMASQEADRRGGVPRPTASGGRDRQQYEAWLREEQERLRGGAVQEETTQREPREERSRDGLQRQRSSDGRERQQRRDRSQRRQVSDGRESKKIAPVQQRERSTQHDRAEARHQRRLDSAYEQRRGRSVVRGDISEILRSRQGVRKAFLLSEVVGRPVSLRRQDEHLIS